MIIDGRAVAEEIQQEIKASISRLSNRKPCLAVILVGEHPPSQIYVSRKAKGCELVGIKSIVRQLPESVTEQELVHEIEGLNQDATVDGILVQLPLPQHINPMTIMQCLDPDKDVDGFHPLNMGKLLIGQNGGFVPCTPLGIKGLLDRFDVSVKDKHIVIIGRSNIVGKPMAALFMQNTPESNATVTTLYRTSRHIKELCPQADILIVAVGQPNLITSEMVKEGVVLIDVGINKIADSSQKNGYQLVGDVDFESVKDKCSYITPVPGGVGPMTIAMLLSNTLLSYQKRQTGCEKAKG